MVKKEIVWEEKTNVEVKTGSINQNTERTVEYKVKETKRDRIVMRLTCV